MANPPRLVQLILGLSLLCLPAVALADGIVETFDVGAGGRLVVDAEGAKVEVRGGAEQVRVEIHRGSDSAREIEEDFDVDLGADGSEVTVELRKRRRFSPGSWFSRGLTIEVEVPRQFDLALETSGGRVSVEDLRGDIRARTSGGSLRFTDVDGPIWGRTSGGSISLSGTSGNADLSTSGGSIRIGEVNGSVEARTSGGSISIERAGGPVTAKTSGGSIEVEEVRGAIDASTSGGGIRAFIAEQPSDDCRLSTSGGTVRVTLAGDVAVDVDAHASGGSVKTDLPVTVQGSFSKSRLEGKLNGGGPRLHLRTSGGSVILEEG